MSKLRILLLEDNALDAELIQAALAEGGLECDATRVQTRDDFRAALDTGCFDLILADYSLPSFDGLSALKLTREKCPQLPFLIVSGAMGEEIAIETLKSGATDYVLKQRLDRLVPSVRRALREAQERAERRQLQEELRRHAEELAEAHHRKDEFLAMLSHELRNPLAPIRNALQIMRLRGIADPTLDQARDIIDRQVNHLAQLVEDLLDVSRITRGKIQLRKERLDLCAVAPLAVETARPLIEGRQHQLSLDLGREPLWVEADPVRLEQIMTNLLTNAAKYTDPGGRIWLTARREGKEAVLQVRDTGIGIAPELQPRIFELFMQADPSLDRSQGGLGIGLTLVRSLVEMHGGLIGVASAGRGQGSEFTVRLPLQLRNGHVTLPRSSEPVREPNNEQPARRVAVVDDNRDGAESLAMLLRLWGHEVYLAHDGPTAVEVVRANQPEVVLLDIGLPGMDGYQVARQLRAESPDRILVALTGYGQDEDRRRAREAGFNHHLTKPVAPEDLQALLKKPEPVTPASGGR